MVTTLDTVAMEVSEGWVGLMHSSGHLTFISLQVSDFVSPHYLLARIVGWSSDKNHRDRTVHHSINMPCYRLENIYVSICVS